MIIVISPYTPHVLSVKYDVQTESGLEVRPAFVTVRYDASIDQQQWEA